jgi:hypothetical protein
VSAPKNKKNAPAGEPASRRPKRKKEKLIRLDDLIPKQNVVGGVNCYSVPVIQHKHQETTQQRKTSMPEKKRKNKKDIKVRHRDMKPKKDAKGGFGVHYLSPTPTRSHLGSSNVQHN